MEEKKCLSISFPKELCFLLKQKPDYVYGIANESHKYYHHSRIPKKRGGFRDLYEPLPELKAMQIWILRNILEPMEVSAYAKAYRKGFSVRDNARFHRGQKMVLSLDIEGFFDHIRRFRVYRVFQAAGYSKAVAMLLAGLCCRNGCLPQGAPTSAALSNLVMKEFDAAVGDFCRERKIHYTRYADDMTFSGDFDEAEVIRFVKQECGKLSLTLNREKTRVRRQGQQQEVTGVVVNQKLQLPEKERKKIRQEIYYIKKYGLNNHLLFIGENRKEKEKYVCRLLGRISYALFINPKDEEMKEYKAYAKELLNS